VRLRRLALAGCLAYGVLALGSGLDRMSEKHPDLAGSVPAWFSSSAARAQAAGAIEAGRGREAQAEARLAILADPVDARAPSLLGQALAISGEGERARGAFEVAGKMGWRDPATQIYWMYTALEARNYEAASQRLDAILRQSPRFDQRDPLLATLEATPAARDKLAARLAERPLWSEVYFLETTGLSDVSLYLRGETARALAGKGVRDCEQVAPLVTAMVERLSPAEARAVWQAQCARGAPGSAPADPGFEQAQLLHPLTPFDWRFTGDGAIDVMLGAQSGFSGQALVVSSTAPGRRGFASQMLLLPAGDHVVRWRAQGEGGAAATAVTVSLECEDKVHRARPARVIDASAGRFEARIAVPMGCPVQWLSLGIDPGSAPVTVDDLSIG